MTTSKRNQGREPPAFQEYAASMMSKMEYRLLNLSQRGLLYSLRLECWVNQSLPSDPQKLATVLGVPVDDVSTNLPKLSKFFCTNGELLTCPDLDKYREYLQDQRNRQSEGGKESRRRSKEKQASTGGSNGEATFSHDASSLQVLRQDKSSADKSNSAFRKEVSVGGYPEDDDIPF